MSDKADRTLDINYLKSPHFREVTSDGIVGGPTPTGKIWVGFFTERFALPRTMRHPIAERGTFVQIQDDGEKIEGMSGLVRTVEFGVYLTANEASELRDWLQENIDALSEETKR